MDTIIAHVKQNIKEQIVQFQCVTVGQKTIQMHVPAMALAFLLILVSAKRVTQERIAMTLCALGHLKHLQMHVLEMVNAFLLILARAGKGISDEIVGQNLEPREISLGLAQMITINF